jgi:hypothetical protein
VPPAQAKTVSGFHPLALEAEGLCASLDPPSPPPPTTTTTTPAVLPPREQEGDQEGEFVRKRRRNWARLIARTWLVDPELCPSCGERMRVVAAISSPFQDDVIEKILRARGEWDPPWKRPRKIRGPPPPPRTQGQGSRSSQSAEEDWPEGIDPPHPEDDFDPPFEEG